jgi:hypothetical protein
MLETARKKWLCFRTSLILLIILLWIKLDVLMCTWHNLISKVQYKGPLFFQSHNANVLPLIWFIEFLKCLLLLENRPIRNSILSYFSKTKLNQTKLTSVCPMLGYHEPWKTLYPDVALHISNIYILILIILDLIEYTGTILKRNICQI